MRFGRVLSLRLQLPPGPLAMPWASQLIGGDVIGDVNASLRACAAQIQRGGRRRFARCRRRCCDCLCRLLLLPSLMPCLEQLLYTNFIQKEHSSCRGVVVLKEGSTLGCSHASRTHHLLSPPAGSPSAAAAASGAALAHTTSGSPALSAA